MRQLRCGTLIGPTNTVRMLSTTFRLHGPVDVLISPMAQVLDLSIFSGVPPENRVNFTIELIEISQRGCGDSVTFYETRSESDVIWRFCGRIKKYGITLQSDWNSPVIRVVRKYRQITSGGQGWAVHSIMNALIMIKPVPLSTSRLSDGQTFVSSAPETDSWLGNPDLALDGIILNKSDELACLQTGEEWAPWWRHQLNERRTFTGIRLFPREGEPLENATVTIIDPENIDENFIINIDYQNESKTYKIHPPRSGTLVELKLKRLKEKRTLTICEVEYVASAGLSDQSEEARGRVRGDNGFYRWEDGSPLTLSLWFSEQPDGSHREQCSMIRMFRRNIARLWHDVTCNQPLTSQYICEISK